MTVDYKSAITAALRRDGRVESMENSRVNPALSETLSTMSVSENGLFND